MAGLVDLTPQRATLLDRHAAVATAAILRRLWLTLRRLPLARLLRLLARTLLIVAPVVITIAPLVMTLLAPLFTVATTPLAIALTGKHTGADNRQQQCHACFADPVVAHFFSFVTLSQACRDGTSDALHGKV